LKTKFAGASILALLAAVAVAGTALAGGPKLQTFGSADVTIDGATVTIATDGDEDPTWGGPEYGGVYLKSKSVSGKLIGNVLFSFTSSGAVTGGAPRFSIPVNSDGTTNAVAFYAFIDAANCGGPFVSTENPACPVFAGAETFANWDAFAAAHPNYRVAPGVIPFIVADGAYNQTYVVSDIVLR
jgi:hypothetical protein